MTYDGTVKPSPRATERALVRCIRKAQMDGLVVVFNAKEIDSGTCAMGACERLGRKAPPLKLPKSTYALCRAYDAIEAGFDGNVDATDDDGRPLPATWIQVGTRLRARFQPIDATVLAVQRDAERRLLVEARVGFTEAW